VGDEHRVRRSYWSPYVPDVEMETGNLGVDHRDNCRISALCWTQWTGCEIRACRRWRGSRSFLDVHPGSASLHPGANNAIAAPRLGRRNMHDVAVLLATGYW